MSGEARALVRYAALLRRRRRGYDRELRSLRDGDRWRGEGQRAVNRALISDARERLPAGAGPFHKGSLTLNALAAIAESDPASAALLVERCRRILQLQQELFPEGLPPEGRRGLKSRRVRKT